MVVAGQQAAPGHKRTEGEGRRLIDVEATAAVGQAGEFQRRDELWQRQQHGGDAGGGQRQQPADGAGAQRVQAERHSADEHRLRVPAEDLHRPGHGEEEKPHPPTPSPYGEGETSEASGGEVRIKQHQQPGEPGQPLKLVNLLDMGAEVPAQREADGPDQRRRPATPSARRASR
ncbi:MAG: hypothetical protein IPK19_30175 [Chloroflexi bacterium]|nr:hypothetical protein [Chloroflexota bacterium]